MTTNHTSAELLGDYLDGTLADAHARASEVEERLRAEHPEIADVIVHTEP
jgi:divalent metal cation (Fe/Co/Zn/Cd) transporter